MFVAFLLAQSGEMKDYMIGKINAENRRDCGERAETRAFVGFIEGNH